VCVSIGVSVGSAYVRGLICRRGKYGACVIEWLVELRMMEELDGMG